MRVERAPTPDSADAIPRGSRSLTEHFHAMTAYPHLLAPSTSVHDPQEPRPDGVHAHRSRGSAGRLRADGRVLRGARAGRVGLIVTAASRRTCRARRADARAALVPLADEEAPDRHRSGARGGGKIAMQILHTGRYAYHPLAVAPSHQIPDQPFRPRALTAGVCERRSRTTRAARPRPARRYDGVEIMAPRVPHQPVHRAADHHRTDEWAAPSRTASASRSRSCAGRASAWARTSSSSSACRCSTSSRAQHVGRDRRARKAIERPGDDHQHGNRLAEARIPTSPRWCRARPSAG